MDHVIAQFAGVEWVTEVELSVCLEGVEELGDLHYPFEKEAHYHFTAGVEYDKE